MGTARTFLHLTGRYWSASTYGMVGHGRKELTPDLLADFATVLGIPADDLAVLKRYGTAGWHPVAESGGGRRGRADLGRPTPDRRPGATGQRRSGVHAAGVIGSCLRRMQPVDTSRHGVTGVMSVTAPGWTASAMPVPVRQPSITAGRYCTILSLRLTARVTWPRSTAARLPMSRLRNDQMPSSGSSPVRRLAVGRK